CIRMQDTASQLQSRVRLASLPASFLLVLLLSLWRSLTWLLLVLLLLLLRGLRHIHLLAVFERIRGVDDDLVSGQDTPENLQCGAVVASNVDGPQLDCASRTNDGDTRTFGTEQH